ncbi:oxygen-insensitive NADPH nitroreductase [Paenibacillus pasadenensis]|uniref:oxygen-insensitive NADPH nitroreductase n=1 Tax=Paenibacillus pasadenensis TaxID=217090 RepID=UPI0020426891|nr:oxygen-insensitive NADPH nitroreductase [Paenibacillus pasadenensis]MCM3746616.1 oxygen-insensitive NADPH nitroreductase [Paenibacillus pasadenensis]
MTANEQKLKTPDMDRLLGMLEGHRSIRRYTDAPVPPEQLERIIACAQMASSSSHMQAYSIIGITDPELRDKLAELAGGQRHVALAPVFLVWCADLSRFSDAVSSRGGELEPSTEYFIVATVDAALAAQNAAVAAEAMGLGIVYIGGIRNDMRAVTELLQLPPLVYPVFGMCIGVPAESPDQRPRLPLEEMYYENRYSPEKREERLEAYDEQYRSYIRDRSGGGRDSAWTQEMQGRNAYPPRKLTGLLREQGFRFDD